jgi:hypothetical protein
MEELLIIAAPFLFFGVLGMIATIVIYRKEHRAAAVSTMQS